MKDDTLSVYHQSIDRVLYVQYKKTNDAFSGSQNSAQFNFWIDIKTAAYYLSVFITINMLSGSLLFVRIYNNKYTKWQLIICPYL